MRGLEGLQNFTSLIAKLVHFHEFTHRNMRGPKSLQNFTSQLTKLVYFCESNCEVLKFNKSRANSKDDHSISKVNISRLSSQLGRPTK